MVLADGVGFQQGAVDVCIGNVDMPPEAEDFGADLFFKARDQGVGANHDRHAEGHGRHRYPQDEPGERLLPGSSDAPCQEEFEIHSGQR